MRGLAAALRSYLLQVAAHVEEDEPDTAALAEALLAPLDTVVPRKTSTPKPRSAQPAPPPLA